MQFLIHDIELRLRNETLSETYLQNISSVVQFKGTKSIQTSEKKMIVKVLPKSNNMPDVSVKILNYTVLLGTLLKKQEAITRQMASLTDTVLLGIDREGTITSIGNHDIIKKKWEALKGEMKEQYQGDVANRYFSGIDKKIESHKKLLLDFQHYRLFGLLWNGLYGLYINMRPDTWERVRTIDHVVFHIPVTVRERITWNKAYSNKDKLELIIKGTLDEEQTFMKKIENHFTREGIVETPSFKLSAYGGMFRFNTKTGLLMDANLKIETMYGDAYHKIQEYTLTKAVS